MNIMNIGSTLARDMAVVPIEPAVLEQFMSKGSNGFKACHGIRDIKVLYVTPDVVDKHMRLLFLISSPDIYPYVSYRRLNEQNPDCEEYDKLQTKTILIATDNGNNIVLLKLPLIDLMFEELEEGERLVNPAWMYYWSENNNDENGSDSGACDGQCDNCGGMHQSYDDDEAEEDGEEECADGSEEEDDQDGFLEGPYDDGFLGGPDDWMKT